MMISEIPPCHVCASPNTSDVSILSQHSQVTSDCKPWSGSPRHLLCENCGVLQKHVTSSWRSEVATLYANYTAYHQADGIEQRVFDPLTGDASIRSSLLFEILRSKVDLKPRGRLLDVGCGNGSFLATFGSRATGWSMVGTELNDRQRESIEQLPGVENLHVGPLDEISGDFSLVSLIHVIEHIVDPRSFLSEIAEKLQEGAWLLVNVPNFMDNPFDTVIADHASHFDRYTIPSLLRTLGFKVRAVVADAIPREVVILAQYGGQVEIPARVVPSKTAVRRRFYWLSQVAQSCRSLADRPLMGIFGSSIAATWLQQELVGAAKFFVDEDPARIGSSHLGLPIVAPSHVQAGSTVIVALVPALSADVARRLCQNRVNYVPLPAW